jgi:hypothetical protein
VNLRKFFVLFILLFVFVLPIFAKYFFDFEQPIADVQYPLDPWIQYRDLAKVRVNGTDTTYLVSVVDNVKWVTQGGHHAAEVRMDTSGNKWLLMCKARWNGMVNALDTLFLTDVGVGDTMYYYLWIPQDAPIDSIFIFERDSIWGWGDVSRYYPEDLTFGCWNELKDGVSLLKGADTMLFPLVQCDFEIHTDSALNHPGLTPGCTLYFDCPSTMGSIMGVFDDTVGQCQAGIIEGPDGITVEASINSVKISLIKSAPITVNVYNVIGQKVYESAGFAPAGESTLDFSDLAKGVYTVRVISGEGSAKLTKLLVIK